MANTFKFGNGNWATKEDSVLAYNDENNNFKPLPFDFTRASTATYVDSDGLIKTAKQGEARIDYTDNTDGHLLLEPSRSNLLLRSEDFTTSWSRVNSSITANQITAPDGTQTADLFQENTATGSHDIRQNKSGLTTGVSYTYSIFVKEYLAGNTRRIAFYIGGVNSSGTFDFSTETLTSSTFDRAEVVKYENGWYRLIISDITTGTTFNNIIILDNGSVASYTGDGTSGFYIWGAQLEQGSYPTSYIPTEGSAVTRLADVCNGAGNSDIFNDSEGVLYAEMSSLSLSGYRALSLSDGTSSNRVQIWLWNDGTIFTYVVAQGSTSYSRFDSVDATNMNKISISYKQNQFNTFINGIKTHSDTLGNTPTGLNNLKFSDIDGSALLLGKIKEIKVYNTALSDSELETLTT